MIHTMVHTWRGRGCSIFIEINVKRQSNPRPPLQCATFYGAQHIVSPAKLFQNMISKSVYHTVHICTTAGVFRAKKICLHIFSCIGYIPELKWQPELVEDS